VKKKVALFGSSGFVGQELFKQLSNNSNYEVFGYTRSNFEEAFDLEFDYVINAAMPAARFKAKNNPLWDFVESVEKTANLFYKLKYKKFILVSSLSARCQRDTIYGHHKYLAEQLVLASENTLIVRLGPMYGPSLTKGVLIDIINRSKVFVSEDSRYAFAPLSFVSQWISENLDQNGIREVGANNSISLKEVASKAGVTIDFEGDVDHQEIENPSSQFPDVNLVFNFLQQKMEK